MCTGASPGPATTGLRQQFIGGLHTIPAIVAIHGVIAADDGHDATAAGLAQPRFGALQRGECAARRRVTAIEEGVQVDALGAALAGQVDHRQDLVLVAVDAAGREQPHDVHGLLVENGLVHGVHQGLVEEEGAVLDRLVDASQVLVDDAAGPQVHVSHFRIAHLSFRQADGLARGSDQRVGAALPEGIPDRGAGGADGVVLGLFAVAPAIENEQQGGGTAGDGV